MDTPADLSPEARSDPFRPPDDPCECFCLHCQRPINSADMWYQAVVNGPPGSTGFWMCPTPNCGGAGFTFDIFPVDPDHPANEGWHSDDDDDDEDGDEPDGDGDEEAEAEYDPDEPQYADEVADEDDDIEGEEWKLGLQPGEPRPESPAQAAAREQYEAEQRKYDEPDRRPRTIDGSHWKARQQEPPPFALGDDDIPF